MELLLDYSLGTSTGPSVLSRTLGFVSACQTLWGTNSGPGDFVQSSTFQSEGSRDTKLVLRYHERLAPFPVQVTSEKMAVMSNV